VKIENNSVCTDMLVQTSNDIRGNWSMETTHNMRGSGTSQTMSENRQATSQESHGHKAC
jgi:hypothetical protein